MTTHNHQWMRVAIAVGLGGQPLGMYCLNPMPSNRNLGVDLGILRI